MPQPWTTDEAVALVGVDHCARRRRSSAEHPLERGEVPLVRVRLELREDAEPDRRHARRPRHLLARRRRAGSRRRGGDRGRRASRRASSRGTGSPRRSRGTSARRGGTCRPADSERPSGAPEATQRVEDRRPVGVDDAFRHSGRAARVAHRRSCVLVELGISSRPGRRTRAGPRSRPRRRSRARSACRP